VTIHVSINLGYEFAVKASAQTVFDLLSDVPASASHFPRVHQLVDLGSGAYRWEMEDIVIGPVSLQTVYASRYVADRSLGRVAWTPVDGEGNARVSGNWVIAPKKASTLITLRIVSDMTLPLPSLIKGVVIPVVESEFEKLVEQYIDRLALAFGGEA
jgi:carbon monoxide dehydrogenase subunit G